MSEENVAIVRRSYEVIAAVGATAEVVDPDTIDPDWWLRFAPDFELRERPDLPDAQVYRGREESKEFWRKLQELFVTFEWRVLDITEVAGAVVVDAHIVGTGRASNAPIEATETDVFWFRDGLLARLSAFATREQALAAVEAG
jgi:ketosteroid isomerase-like protein